MLATSYCPDHSGTLLPGLSLNERLSRCGVYVVLLFLCCLPTALIAAEKGRFEVRSADARLVDGVYFATARIDYQLSTEALEALESGVTLTIQLQVEVFRARRFWPDKNVANLQKSYALSFQPLTALYVVKNVNSGNQSSFRNLSGALDDLGRVVDLPVIDAAVLEQDSHHRIALRVVLDQNTLPGPLQMLAFWSDGFRLESDWYRWKLSE